jgi:F0F1-type ATP synthase membrane subunit a
LLKTFYDNSILFNRLTIIVNDPIEQYDLGVLEVCGMAFYPAYLQILFIAILICIFTGSIKMNIFGYLNHKVYSFLKDLFINVIGPNKHQMLFPYFYYIFLFILLCNLCGMAP